MKLLFKLKLLLCLVGLLQVVITAQVNISDKKSFKNKTLSFDYPADWKITDKSTSKVQQINVTSANNVALIMVMVYEPKISTYAEFYQAKVGTAMPYIESITKRFSSAGESAVQSDACLEVKSEKVTGLKISGVYENEPSTSQIFSFVMNNRFVNLIYMRADKESVKADAAWEAVTKNLSVNDNQSGKASDVMVDLMSGVILNGSAIKLPEPMLPSGWRAAWRGYTTEVEVRVVVDEKGEVVSAKALSGDPKLHPAVIQAAKESKFTPALVCGELAKISGVIVYRFVTR